ncbi:WEB family protein At1g75720 [Impatiens glandulifera]|uniref:WEB family protein At1g75720 n=1 Tax=Impatiens glandulifera TaxID=253017 RepID=UPI001FB10575|nr:WEB family protein At1g75720 [Impatiens glandulifera]
METEPSPQSPHHSESDPINNNSSSSSFSVDTSRPFSSVKEAVAIFGEKLISGELYSYPKPLLPSSTPRRLPSLSFSEIQPASYEDDTPRNLTYYYYTNGFKNGDSAIVDAVRRIEADLEQTKTELRILKMRESETEVILASLNAELHRSMSIIAKAEAVEAAMAAKERENINGGGMREKAATLGQILNCREEERFSLKNNKNKKKMKKPIVPLLLLRDLFSRKKKGI